MAENLSLAIKRLALFIRLDAAGLRVENLLEKNLYELIAALALELLRIQQTEKLPDE